MEYRILYDRKVTGGNIFSCCCDWETMHRMGGSVGRPTLPNFWCIVSQSHFLQLCRKHFGILAYLQTSAARAANSIT